jgi:hypothetical protein
MTIEECYNQCNGFTYFGVEYGGECKSLAKKAIGDAVLTEMKVIAVMFLTPDP